MTFISFFSNIQTIEMIRKHALPELRSRRFIKIWDAGCESEIEPYVLAMLIRQLVGHMYFRNVKITATDINVTDINEDIILEKSYPAVEVDKIPKEIFDSYFEPDEKSGYFKVIDEIKDQVAFHEHNLLSLKPVEENFALILCRNVLPAFNEDKQKEVIKMFHDSLVEHGFLSLGTLGKNYKLPKEFANLFELIDKDTNLYRKKV